ncbi:MAG: selenide, water dikinase SelD, partial [Oscillospiraceae bacterium]|nr:selenide, water dikinase SelD [Candidatus Ruminococcus equi]
MENECKLTKLSSCSGCGAKVGAGTLSKLLGDLKVNYDENLLVGFDKSDDACVYKISDDLAVVQTVDFFPPIADDPYIFGQIAATNALSDIYAMGATPKFALNVMCIPKDMDKETVRKILKGGYDKVYEAGAVISGGHSIYDDEPKYGLTVTGFVNPKKMLTNSGVKEGDVLIYTKPLGIGIITTAMKAGIAEKESVDKAIETMTFLNKSACECMSKYDVHACTDVTGFSMLGHLLEMAQGSNVKINLFTENIEVINGTYDFAKMGILPEGMYRNREYAEKYVDMGDTPLYIQDVLFDPQTSGGLLISVDEKDSEKLLADLRTCTLSPNIVAKAENYDNGKYIILV